MFKRYILVDGKEYEVFTKQIKKSVSAVAVQKEYYYTVSNDGIVKMVSTENRPVDSIHWNKELKCYKNFEILKTHKRISGDTYKINTLLKSIGFTFNWTEKVWVK